MTDFVKILDTIDGVMMTVKNVTDIPGVNLIPYVSTASSVIGTIHALYSGGKLAAGHLQEIQATFNPGAPPPSEEKLDALAKRMAELRAELHAPMPPKEADEPE
jgi:hypothetical protein